MALSGFEEYQKSAEHANSPGPAAFSLLLSHKDDGESSPDPPRVALFLCLEDAEFCFAVGTSLIGANPV